MIKLIKPPIKKQTLIHSIEEDYYANPARDPGRLANRKANLANAGWVIVVGVIVFLLVVLLGD